VDTRGDIRQFLVTRRARLTPEAVGLPRPLGHRRVPGLRREEAAALAGVSVEYYTRLERGDATGVSDAVLDALCRGLALDEAERAHLTDLVRGPGAASRRPRRRPSRQVPPTVQRVLDSMGSAPAFVSNPRLDLVATNDLCAALYADLDDHSGSQVNLARYTFLDPRAEGFYVDWAAVAEMTVALLRTSAGHDPLDRDLTDLVGELATRSEDFRGRWAAHPVQMHTSGRKRIHHPVVGELDLAFDSFALAADPTLTVTAYTADPGSATEERLSLLASWGASKDRATDPSGGRPGVDAANI